jgi:hypothetical protein
MSNLLTDVLGNIGDEALSNVGQKFGIPKDVTNSLSKDSLAVILGGLAKNSQDKAGAEKLLEVLKKDHRENLDIKDKIINGEVDKKGKGILKHSLGDKEDKILKALSKKNNLSEDETKGFLETAAPLLMGALAKTTEKTNMDSNILGQVLNMAFKSDLDNDKKSSAGILTILDLDKDGKVIDDLPKI